MYIDEVADFKQDVFKTINEQRYNIFQFCFTLNHAPFLLKRFLPIVLSHTQVGGAPAAAAAA